MNKDEELFMTGPIPGMSLTSEPRNVPWENPPMHTTVEEAISYYTEKLLDPEMEDSIIDVLDNKVDIETIADHLITSSVMNGMHSLDVGILVNPVVRELVMLVADSTDTPYVESYKQQEKGNRVPRSMARQIVRQAMQEQQQQTLMPEPTQPMQPTDMPQEYRGLMAPVNTQQVPVR
jgi:hypothetical protein